MPKGTKASIIEADAFLAFDLVEKLPLFQSPEGHAFIKVAPRRLLDLDSPQFEDWFRDKA